MVANLTRFNLFGNTKDNSKDLPGKTGWKTTNTNEQGRGGTTGGGASRHQDSWVHVSNGKRTNTNRTNSSSSYSSHSSSSTSPSIKIPSNNEFYSIHKQKYRHDNKENKKWPNSCSDQSSYFGGSRTRGISESDARGRSKTTSGNYASSPSSSSYTSSSRNRSPGERLRESQGDVLMDWVSKMDL